MSDAINDSNYHTSNVPYESEYVCGHCGRRYITLSVLESHNNISHGGEYSKYSGEKSFIVKTPQEDKVNHPNHYNQYGMETIKAIEKQSTPDEFRGYLKGNIMKYVARYRFKNGCEDLEKAEFYIEKLIEFERILELKENGRVKK